MAANQLEPLTLSAGDTLSFERYLVSYLPSDGWGLQYQVRGGARGNMAVQFSSTPDATNTLHQVTVDASVTALWFPGEWLLVGYAVKTTERHQIYSDTFIVTPNLNTGANDANVQTHAQKMIALLECQLEELAKHPISASDVQGTRIMREKRKDLEWQLALNIQKRQNEIAIENVRNGRPSGNKIRPVMNMVSPGPAIGSGPSWPFAPA